MCSVVVADHVHNIALAVFADETQIQTKFSPYKAGKDPALYPYGTSKSIPEQVLQSVASSFVNLGVHYVDCLILHSLYPDMADTLKAWRAMEALVPSKALTLGLSNVDAESLQQICEAARIKPNSVQNRFTGDTSPRPEANLPPGLPYPAVPYDRDVRKLCDKHDITYVPWGLLWGNAPITDDDPMLGETAKKLGISKQVAWYACVEDLAGCKTSMLCGTTKETTMETTLNDLDKLEDLLNEDEDHLQAYAICLEHIRPIVNGPRADSIKTS